MDCGLTSCISQKNSCSSLITFIAYAYNSYTTYLLVNKYIEPKTESCIRSVLPTNKTFINLLTFIEAYIIQIGTRLIQLPYTFYRIELPLYSCLPPSSSGATECKRVAVFDCSSSRNSPGRDKSINFEYVT